MSKTIDEDFYLGEVLWMPIYKDGRIIQSLKLKKLRKFIEEIEAAEIYVHSIGVTCNTNRDTNRSLACIFQVLKDTDYALKTQPDYPSYVELTVLILASPY
ncbi:uncharacterized protein EV154DRAFT_476363 [Mucor mucedo]|uniref:uncharacterized protein n=1 Tax=Mucor mucedo TaxID=29922 RepID=UPI00221E46CF|nr:uncharacterized protein EV154DRAFT_476363 [Mucor mucedo]KAI7896726.1 hypothetical protein EV154DRAFT_476363 [Mucor mucedo]